MRLLRLTLSPTWLVYLEEEEIWTEGRWYEEMASMSKRKAWNTFFLHSLQRNWPANTLILDFKPPELWEYKFLLFKPPSLWYFVIVALENLYSAHKYLIKLSQGQLCQYGKNGEPFLIENSKVYIHAEAITKEYKPSFSQSRILVMWSEL